MATSQLRPPLVCNVSVFPSSIRILSLSCTDSNHPWAGFQVAQVRVIFEIPDKGLNDLFPALPADARPKHLAYVEWFTPFTLPHPDHGLYTITRSLMGTSRRCSIIPLEQIERSCHLYPEFGPVAPREWTSSTVLDLCPSFYVNPFVDKYTYKLIY